MEHLPAIPRHCASSAATAAAEPAHGGGGGHALHATSLHPGYDSVVKHSCEKSWWNGHAMLADEKCMQQQEWQTRQMPQPQHGELQREEHASIDSSRESLLLPQRPQPKRQRLQPQDGETAAHGMIPLHAQQQLPPALCMPPQQSAQPEPVPQLRPAQRRLQQTVPQLQPSRQHSPLPRPLPPPQQSLRPLQQRHQRPVRPCFTLLPSQPRPPEQQPAPPQLHASPPPPSQQHHTVHPAAQRKPVKFHVRSQQEMHNLGDTRWSAAFAAEQAGLDAQLAAACDAKAAPPTLRPLARCSSGRSSSSCSASGGRGACSGSGQSSTLCGVDLPGRGASAASAEFSLLTPGSSGVLPPGPPKLADEAALLASMLSGADWEMAAPTESELEDLRAELGLDPFGHWF